MGIHDAKSWPRNVRLRSGDIERRSTHSVSRVGVLLDQLHHGLQFVVDARDEHVVLVDALDGLGRAL